MEFQNEATMDWNKGRVKRTVWRPYKQPDNIFVGNSVYEISKLDNVRIKRLSIQPDSKKTIPSSFTVNFEPEWTTIKELNLPFNVHWQQSANSKFDLNFQLEKGQKCLALGERFSGLNLRGQKHTLISTDNPEHDEAMDPMYKPIPFLVIGSADKYWGLYIDSSAPSRFDLDSELTGEALIEIFTTRGFRLYFFELNSLPNLISAFTSLVGRAKLPPLWALGYQQSRWSYPDETTVRELARELRQRQIPCDTIVLDIDYMDEYRVFTTAKERFPNLKELISDLAADNFKVVMIVDPGVKEDISYKQFNDGKKQDLFCKTSKGEIFLEKVWPGSSAFPDFLKKKLEIGGLKNINSIQM